MRDRCYREKCLSYKNYGGRGITVCAAWNNNYEQFRDWALKNGYDDNLTIDRIDNDEGYEPSNCKFSTRQEQVFNRRQLVLPNTGFVGITKTRFNTYSARLSFNNKEIFFKTYKTIDEAIYGRDEFIIDHNLPNEKNNKEKVSNL